MDKAEMRWISVKDRLPDDRQEVLTLWLECKQIQVQRFCLNYGKEVRKVSKHVGRSKVMWVVEFFGGWGFYLVVTDRVEHAIALAKEDLRKRTDENPRVEKVERHRYRVILDAE